MMTNLAKIIFLLLFTLGISYGAWAQVPAAQSFRNNGNSKSILNQGGSSKLASVKKDYLDKQLNLTSEESKKFWPLYKQYQQQMVTIRKLKRLNSTTEKVDASEQIKKDLYYETQLVETRKRYNEQFLKILPPEKVNELYKSEVEFNAEVIKQLSERSERAGN